MHTAYSYKKQIPQIMSNNIFMHLHGHDQIPQIIFCTHFVLLFFNEKKQSYAEWSQNNMNPLVYYSQFRYLIKSYAKTHPITSGAFG
jgi:hypothetical protein